MSGDNWQVGDLALCVDATPNRSDPIANLLEVGKIYKVIAVGITIDGRLRIAFRELILEPRLGWAWTAERFRKIKPDAHEPCEAEFVTLLKRNRVPA